MLFIIFIFLLIVKYAGIAYIAYPDLSWGWILMPLFMGAWHELNRPNNQ